MNAMQVDVMTAISRVAYGDENGCLDHLRDLDHEQLVRAAYGLAAVANSLLTAYAESLGDGDAEQVRERWLLQLTDAANDPSPGGSR